MADDTFEQSSQPRENGQTAPASRQVAASYAAPVTSDDSEATESRDLLPFLAVGIGASAGGVEAYIDLFKQLPANTGMAFVVVPHLSADQRSYLPWRRWTLTPTKYGAA
jgi:chemotaxis response regulator CheB